MRLELEDKLGGMARLTWFDNKANGSACIDVDAEEFAVMAREFLARLALKKHPCRNDWTPCRIMREFETSEDDVAGIELLFSVDDPGSYCGSALIVFRRGGKLYEVNASHCSCYGFESQWKPEETTLTELKTREPYWNDNDEKNDADFKAFLVWLEANP